MLDADSTCFIRFSAGYCRGMTEDELGRAVEHLLADFLLNIHKLQLTLKAHEEVVKESASHLERLIANRLQILRGPDQAQRLIRRRSLAVELLRGRRYEELAELLGSLWSGTGGEF